MEVPVTEYGHRKKEVVFVVLLYFMKLEVCFCLQIGTTNNYSIVYNYLQLMQILLAFTESKVSKVEVTHHGGDSGIQEEA